MKKIFIMVLCLVLVLSLAGCGNEIPGNSELSRLVGDAIIADNSSSYLDGECSGEGHKILGYSKTGNRLTVYALTMFGNYGFQNDMFTKVSGSGVIPAVLTFEKTGEAYNLLDIEYPRDGTEYVKSIMQMFPLKHRIAALNCDAAHDKLKAQEQNYAKEYLIGIEREAEIGEFRDLDVVLLTDLGVSVPVSNKLSGCRELADYPFWVGTTEHLDNGVRYVRSLSYDEEAGQIIYTTVEKGTGVVTECFVFDAATGDALSAGTVVSQMAPVGPPVESCERDS